MKFRMFVVGQLQANCYVLYDNEPGKCVIIDPGAANTNLENFLQTFNLEPTHIILTHGHGDHTGAVKYFLADYPDCKLIANKHEKKLLYDRDLSFGKGGMEADIWVDDGEEMDLAGIHFKFIHTPGHTPGGMCILVEDLLFSGDTLFCSSVGRTDFPGGDFAALITSIRTKLFTLPDDTAVLPGHMNDTTIGNEKVYNPFV